MIRDRVLPIPVIPGQTVDRLVLVVGVVGFALLVYGLGAGSVLANLQVVGWGVVPIVLQEILAIAANTAGWRAAFPPSAPPVPLRSLLAARIAGDAVNYLTPTATLGGEFVRSRVLLGAAPATSIVASIAVAKLTQTIGLFVFVTVGVAVVVDRELLPPPIRSGLVIGLGILALVLILFVLAQQRGMFSPILRLLERRFAFVRALDLEPAIRRLDREIASVHARSHARLALSSMGFCLGWALGAVESYLILWFLGLPVTVERALAVEVLGVAWNNLLFFVPLRAGAQEAGKVLIFVILGFEPAQGLAAGLLYRLRELTWALVGLAILTRHSTRSRPTPCARDRDASSNSVTTGELRE